MGIYDQIVSYARDQLKGKVLGWKKGGPETRWDNLTYRFREIKRREDKTCLLFEIIDEGEDTGDEEVFSLDDLSELEVISSAQNRPKSTKDIARGHYNERQVCHPFEPEGLSREF